MNIGEKIKLRRDQLGRTQQEIADYIGVSKSAISKYEKGDIEKIGIDKLVRLAEILMIDPMDIIKDTDFEGDVVPNASNTKKIPLIGWIMNGPEITDNDTKDSLFVDSRIDADLAIKIIDDSLQDLCASIDSIALIRRQRSIMDGDIGLILIGNRLILRRYESIDGKVLLHALSKSIKSELLNASEINVIGRLQATLITY